MQSEQATLAATFFTTLPTGSLPAGLFTEDATVWTTSGGEKPIEALLQGAAMFVRVFQGDLRYDVDATTQQDDRLVAEVRSAGTLISGEPYDTTLVFIFRFRDGRIAAVAEHNNPAVVREKLMPLFAQIMASPAA